MAQVNYIGHATVLIDIGTIRALTDPVLRDRVFFLQRHGQNPAPPLLDERQPDVVILDLLMPRVDGFAVIKELRSSPRYAALSIIVLTTVIEDASRRRYELETGLEMDVQDYVEKPVAPSDLVRRVKDLLERPYVLVVDDGSSDGTSAAAGEAGAAVLRHEVNLGKGAALKTGFEYAVEKAYDAVITMDGDGQHDPAAIPDFLDAVEKAVVNAGATPAA